LARLHPADIARIADAVPRAQATEIVASLDDELAADTMEEMIDAKQADVIEELEPERAADILDRMAPWPISPHWGLVSSRPTRATTPAASPRTHRSARPMVSACYG
jgi:flagellar motility protein MotE (MotC chaperone)